MRAALNSDTFFNTIALARQGSGSLILVVEGEDDHFLVKGHINDSDVLLIAGVGGKENLLDAARRAQKSGMRGVRFLLDLDYDGFVRRTSRYPANVVASTHHDVMVDVIVVSHRLLDRVINSHTRTARRKGVVVDAKQVREEAFELAASVAPLRVANHRNGFGLTLNNFPFGELRTTQPTPADLAKLVSNRTGNRLDATTIEAEIVAEQRGLGDDPIMLVGDHDFFRALARVLQEHGVPGVGHSALSTAFLSGVICEHLTATGWYQELEAWGVSNSRATFACPCAA